MFDVDKVEVGDTIYISSWKSEIQIFVTDVYIDNGLKMFSTLSDCAGDGLSYKSDYSKRTLNNLVKVPFLRIEKTLAGLELI